MIRNFKVNSIFESDDLNIFFSSQSAVDNIISPKFIDSLFDSFPKPYNIHTKLYHHMIAPSTFW